MLLMGRQRAREEGRHKPGIPAAPAGRPGHPQGASGVAVHPGARGASVSDEGGRHLDPVAAGTRQGEVLLHRRAWPGKAPGEDHRPVLAGRVHPDVRHTATPRAGAFRSPGAAEHRRQRVPVHAELCTLVAGPPSGVQRCASICADRSPELDLDPQRCGRIEDAAASHERATRSGCQREDQGPQTPVPAPPLDAGPDPALPAGRRGAAPRRRGARGPVGHRSGEATGHALQPPRGSECGVGQQTVV